MRYSANPLRSTNDDTRRTPVFENVAQILVVVLLLLGPLVRPGFTQLLLFDGFPGPKISTKWVGDQFQRGTGGGLEISRKIVTGRLVMSHRVAGGTSSNSGTHFSTNRLLARTATPITAIKVDIQVNYVKLTACSATGSTPSSGDARAFSAIFNDGSGDIGMVVILTRTSSDPATKVEAIGYVYRINTGAVIGSTNLGPVTVGTFVTLGMNWDPAGNKVDFQKNAEAIRSVSYTLPDSMPPVNGFGSIEVVGFAANCTSGEARLADVKATFDNVFVEQ